MLFANWLVAPCQVGGGCRNSSPGSVCSSRKVKPSHRYSEKTQNPCSWLSQDSPRMGRVRVHSTAMAAPTDRGGVDGPLVDVRDCLGAGMAMLGALDPCDHHPLVQHFTPFPGAWVPRSSLVPRAAREAEVGRRCSSWCYPRDTTTAIATTFQGFKNFLFNYNFLAEDSHTSRHHQSVHISQFKRDAEEHNRQCLHGALV